MSKQRTSATADITTILTLHICVDYRNIKAYNDADHIVNEEANPEPNKRGRPQAVSDPIKAKLVEEAKIQDLAKNSFTREKLSDFVFEEQKKEKRESGLTDLTVDPISKSVTNRLIHECLPEKVPHAHTQNERRLEALMDLSNHIDFAAMWPAVVGTGEDKIPPSNVFNWDATSLLLELNLEATEMLHLAEGSKAELKKKGLSPSTTKTRKEASLKKRGISVIALTSADGALPCVIVKFKDAKYNEVNVYKVSAVYIRTCSISHSTPLHQLSIVYCMDLSRIMLRIMDLCVFFCVHYSSGNYRGWGVAMHTSSPSLPAKDRSRATKMQAVWNPPYRTTCNEISKKTRMI